MAKNRIQPKKSYKPSVSQIVLAVISLMIVLVLILSLFINN